MQKIGRNRNINDTPNVLLGVIVGSVASLNIVTLTDKDSKLIITNDGNQDAFIRLYDESVDSIPRGFIIYKGTTGTLDMDGVVYPGPVSAITRVGSTLLYLTVI